MMCQNEMSGFLFLLLCLEICVAFRVKRDDGSFGSNSGGPVASSSKDGNKTHEHSDVGCSDQAELPYRRNAIHKKKNNLPIRKKFLRKDDSVMNSAKVLHDFVPPKFPKKDTPKMGKIGDNNRNGNGLGNKGKGSGNFDQFSEKFGRKYKTFEVAERNKIYEDNSKIASSLNSARTGKLGAMFGTTKFSDWKFTEFKKKLGGTLPPDDDEKIIKLQSNDNVRSLAQKLRKFNWADAGVFPAVREQKECGSCYAISSMDLLSSQTLIENKSENQTLAPQYVIDCFQPPAGFGCDGGRPKTVLDRIESCPTCGVPQESCYPYVDHKDCCKKPTSCSNTNLSVVKFSQLVDVSGLDEKDLMAVLLQWGPVVAIVEINEAWQFYNGSGILTADHCHETADHAVLIVGYDYTSEIPHYIIRNSWGADWGENGYIRLEAGSNACEVGSTVLVLCTKNCDGITSAQDLLGTSNAESFKRKFVR